MRNEIRHPRMPRGSGAAADLRQLMFTEGSEDRHTFPLADRRVSSPTDQLTRRQAGVVIVDTLTVIAGLSVFGLLALFFWALA